MTSRFPRPRAAVALPALALVATLLATGWWAAPWAAPKNHTVELRSWVVAGRGRHLFAQIIPPGGAPTAGSENRPTGSRDREWPADLPLVVEYWSTALRDEYTPPADPARAERIARMPLGRRVKPAYGAPDNRLEATYRVTAKQARRLARDRVFANRYFILGPNSTSGLRAALEAAGLRLPARILRSRGALGEFPGVDLTPGREIPPAKWPDFGLRLADSPAPPQPRPRRIRVSLHGDRRAQGNADVVRGRGGRRLRLRLRPHHA